MDGSKEIIKYLLNDRSEFKRTLKALTSKTFRDEYDYKLVYYLVEKLGLPLQKFEIDLTQYLLMKFLWENNFISDDTGGKTIKGKHCIRIKNCDRCKYRYNCLFM